MTSLFLKVAISQRLIQSDESPRAVARSVKVRKSTLYRHLPAAISAVAEASP